MDTVEPLPSSHHSGPVTPRLTTSSTSTAAETGSQPVCPALTNETHGVQQFIASHEVNGGIANLMTDYLNELAQRCHFTW